MSEPVSAPPQPSRSADRAEPSRANASGDCGDLTASRHEGRRHKDTEPNGFESALRTASTESQKPIQSDAEPAPVAEQAKSEPASADHAESTDAMAATSVVMVEPLATSGQGESVTNAMSGPAASAVSTSEWAWKVSGGQAVVQGQAAMQSVDAAMQNVQASQAGVVPGDTAAKAAVAVAAAASSNTAMVQPLKATSRHATQGDDISSNVMQSVGGASNAAFAMAEPVMEVQTPSHVGETLRVMDMPQAKTDAGLFGKDALTSQANAATTMAAQTTADADAEFASTNAGRIARAMEHARQDQAGTVTVRLTPSSLGTVRIEIAEHEGRIAASFHTQTARAEKLLTAHSMRLQSALEDRGMQVERLSVQQLAAGPSATASSREATPDPDRQPNGEQQRQQSQQHREQSGDQRQQRGQRQSYQQWQQQAVEQAQQEGPQS